MVLHRLSQKSGCPFCAPFAVDALYDRVLNRDFGKIYDERATAAQRMWLGGPFILSFCQRAHRMHLQAVPLSFR